ncbi:hypothetical protein EON65_14275, partial [archaeon]
MSSPEINFVFCLAATLRSNSTVLSSLELQTGDWVAITIPKDQRPASTITSKPSRSAAPASAKQSSPIKASIPITPTTTPSQPPKNKKKVFTVKDLEAERQKLLQMRKETVQGEVEVYMLQDDERGRGEVEGGRRRRGRRASPMQGAERTLQRVAQQGGRGLVFGRMKEVGADGRNGGGSGGNGKLGKKKSKKRLEDGEDSGKGSKYIYEVLAVCELPPILSPLSILSSPLCMELKEIGEKSG